MTVVYPSGLARILADRRLFIALLVLNALVTLAVCYGFRTKIAGDHYTYLGYVEGLWHGRYSYWYFYPDYIPDTLRNPGYPLFLYGLSFLGKGVAVIQIAQLILYGVAVQLVVRVIRRFSPDEASGLLTANCFLLLLLPNVQMAYCTAVVLPEILTTFLVTAYFAAVVYTTPGRWTRAVALGLLGGVLFQVRPIFILFPLIQLALEWWFRRPQFRTTHALVQLVIYGLTMVPYGLWNKQHHGHFKVTSMEGGAGVMQLGFWSFRMPGYKEMRTFGNTMGDEPIKFVAPADVPRYIQQFNQEWDEIDRQLLPYHTHQDSMYIEKMFRDYPLLIVTRSTPLTRKREELMLKSTLAHIAAEPGYYLKTRIFTFFRLYITGIQIDELAAARGPAGVVKVLYPFVVSVLTFLLAVICIPLALRGRRIGSFPYWLAFALTLYFGVIHVPFAIQARYTTPIRLLLLYVIAISVAALLRPRPTTSIVSEKL